MLRPGFGIEIDQTMNRARAGGILGGLGVLFTVVSVFFGALSTGSTSAIPLFFLKTGIAFTILGAATIRLRDISVENAFIVSIVTFAAMYLVGAAVTYRPLSLFFFTLENLVARHGSGTLVLAPILAGFVAGVLENEGHRSTAFRVFAGTMVGAWIIATLVLFVGGQVAPLGLGPPMVYTIVAAFLGVLPRNLLRQVRN